jgi:hypothetical protein
MERNQTHSLAGEVGAATLVGGKYSICREKLARSKKGQPGAPQGRPDNPPG